MRPRVDVQRATGNHLGESPSSRGAGRAASSGGVEANASTLLHPKRSRSVGGSEDRRLAWGSERRVSAAARTVPACKSPGTERPAQIADLGLVAQAVDAFLAPNCSTRLLLSDGAVRERLGPFGVALPDVHATRLDFILDSLLTGQHLALDTLNVALENISNWVTKCYRSYSALVFSENLGCKLSFFGGRADRFA